MSYVWHVAGPGCLCPDCITPDRLDALRRKRAAITAELPRGVPFTWAGWDTCAVANDYRWQAGVPLVSRRACRAQEHPERECWPTFEGAYWSALGPSAFPNRR